MCINNSPLGSIRELNNNKVLNLIDTKGITPAEALKLYTGKGKLHGLNFNQFGSFHEYTSAKKEIENGQFFTPDYIVERITKLINPIGEVLDPTAGAGIFCKYLNEENFTGVEIDPTAAKVAKYCFPAANIERGNIQFWDNRQKKFDYILTNPPFNLKWGKVTSQSFILRQSLGLLKKYGIFAAVVPVTWLQDEMYFKKDIEFINHNFNWLGQIELGKDTFKTEYNIEFKTKVVLFQHCEGQKHSATFQTWEEMQTIVKDAQKERRSNLIAVAQSEERENDYSFTDSLRDPKKGYDFQVRKLIYEIKSHQGEKELLKASDLLQRFKDQVQPSNVDHNKWIKTALTTGKVLYRLRVIAGFNRKKRTKKTFRPPNQMQIKPFSELQPTEEIKEYVKTFTFKNSIGKFSLNEIQQKDVSKLISKKYAALNSEQGTGKTAMSFAVCEYRETKLNIILAPALAINTTWKDHLTLNEKSFKIIKREKDIDFKVDYWLFSYSSLSIRERLPKILKKQLRRISNNVQLVCDESDELSNRSSKRYKATRTAFKNCRYKLLTTGTMTRNNVSELYPQLELLYNNSSDLLDHCSMVYTEEKAKTGESTILSKENENEGKTFNGYHGFEQFKRCFSPTKSTVLGIKKHTQDVYNYEQLTKIINYTSIIRTFKEVAGDKYQIKHLTIEPSFEEKTLQETVLKEFQQIVYKYYNNTGNTRKESALRIIRQLQLLIKSCSIPQTFEHYTGKGCTKLSRIMKLVREKNEKTLIGCTTIKAAQIYRDAAKKAFDRPVYLITGATSFKRRKKILEEFEETTNGIVICTQQSLKSSINIPSCNLVICESIQWNLPKMSQFYFRCIRFNSKENTTIYFVTYSNTIEDNLLGLLMTKEKINKSIKLESNSIEEVFNEFDIDLSTFDNMMCKTYEKDKDGNKRVNISWGKQEIIN